MSKVTGAINKALTSFLRQKGLTPFAAADGRVISREEQLAEMLWQQALGWQETTRDEEGNIKIVEHKPVQWAQQFLWERLEGKASSAAPAESGSGAIRAVDKVRALAKDRLNALAAPASAPPEFRSRDGEGDSGPEDSPDSGGDAEHG